MILWDCFTYFCLKAKQQRGKEKGGGCSKRGRKRERMDRGGYSSREVIFHLLLHFLKWSQQLALDQVTARSSLWVCSVGGKKTILGHLPSSPRYINRSLNWKYKVARSNKGCNHLKWWLNLLCHNCPVVYRSNSSHFYIPISAEVHICHSGDKMEWLLEFTDCLVGM